MPGFAVRLTSHAIFLSLTSLFIAPGVDIIVGFSPTEIAALTGCTIVQNPSYATEMAVPNVPVFDQALPDGTLAPLNVSSGFLPDGRQWAWQCSVEEYIGGALPTVPVFHVRCGTYVGNGTTQTITLGLDLTQPNSAVWVAPITAEEAVSFRHNGMSSTYLSGSTSAQANALTLTATGFTAGPATFLGTPIVNHSGVTYGYVAITNPDGAFVKTGLYTGNGTSKVIEDPNNPFGPTHIWIWGSSAVYTSTELGAGNAIILGKQAGGQITTGLITALSPMSVGNSNIVNANGNPYFYLAVKNTGVFLSAGLLRSGVFAGDGSAAQGPGAQPFPLGWVYARRFDNVIADGDWRIAAGQAGTASSTWGGNGNTASGGINTLSGAVFTAGSVVAPAGVSCVWFVLPSAGDSGGGGGGGSGCVPNGVIGVPYYKTLVASGGTAPYVYTLTNGALPSGLVLIPGTGAIVGVPTTAGTYSYTIVARDITGAIVQTFTCTQFAIVTTAAITELPVSASSGGAGCVNTLGAT